MTHKLQNLILILLSKLFEVLQMISTVLVWLDLFTSEGSMVSKSSITTKREGERSSDSSEGILLSTWTLQPSANDKNALPLDSVLLRKPFPQLCLMPVVLITMKLMLFVFFCNFLLNIIRLELLYIYKLSLIHIHTQTNTGTVDILASLLYIRWSCPI